MSKRAAEKRTPKPSVRGILAVSLPIVAAGIALDRISKDLVTVYLKGSTPVELIPGVLRLRYSENTGAAFSILEGQRWFFLVLTVLVLGIAVYALLRGWVRSLFGVASVACCISGAIGNFVDRLTQGYVVDMIEPTFMRFAVFNVADSFLTVGCILLAVYLLFFHEQLAPKESSGSAADSEEEK